MRSLAEELAQPLVSKNPLLSFSLIGSQQLEHHPIAFFSDVVKLVSDAGAQAGQGGSASPGTGRQVQVKNLAFR